MKMNMFSPTVILQMERLGLMKVKPINASLESPELIAEGIGQEFEIILQEKCWNNLSDKGLKILNYRRFLRFAFCFRKV